MSAAPAPKPRRELLDPFEEMDQAAARDRQLHPPGKNIWGRPVVVESQTWKIHGRLADPPLNPPKRRTGRGTPPWEPTPALLAEIKSRLSTQSGAAIARALHLDVDKIYELAKRGLIRIPRRHGPKLNISAQPGS